MGIVAHADGDFDSRESNAIRQHLQTGGAFSHEALEILMTIIEDEAVRGLDRSRLIAELFVDSNFDERVSILDMLFLIAAADGGLTHAELETLRGVSAGMNLSHKQYIEAKVRARSGALHNGTLAANDSPPFQGGVAQQRRGGCP